MLVIPYLFSPMGNPITIGAAALRPSLQRTWRRLILRLNGQPAVGRPSQWALQPLWNFVDIGEIAPADHHFDDGASDLEYYIAVALLLTM